MRRLLLALLVVLALPASALAAGFHFPSVSKNLKVKPRIGHTHGPAPKSLKVKDVVLGHGRRARPGDTVRMRYVGELYGSGKQFDASWDHGQPLHFALGAGQVIPGFDRGVKGMRVGGRRILVIPPRLGYGAAGAPPAIPPSSTLIFVVDLVGATR
jgi:FKBP-type peptidyl-prolyl cis-trans isomerase